MEKLCALLLLSFLAHQSVSAQEIPIPNGYVLFSKTQGDLDKDGTDELVVAYNTGEIKNELEGVDRELQIFKLNNGSWTLWVKSESALLRSNEGGMMSDPFEGIEIKNGILLISHYGGTSWQWGYTDKYRFQNGEFKLIGLTKTYGKMCEYWAEFDFNLSTGKAIYTKQYKQCDENDEEIDPVVVKIEEETFIKKGISVSLTNRHDKEIKITSPKYKIDFYL